MSTHTAVEGVSAKKYDVKKLTVLGLFIAMGYVCLFIFNFKVQFLTIDFKDVFITMTGFIYGPAVALIVALVESLLELITISTTGPWGALMNFVESSAFACTASIVYKYNKSFKGAVIGLCTAVITMTALMMPMNLLIVPIYTHTDMKTVAGMIPKLLLPFNFLKGLLCASFTFLLYKPLTQALRGMRIMPRNSADFEVNKKTAAGLVIAALMIAVSLAVVFVVFKGQFEMVKSAK